MKGWLFNYGADLRGSGAVAVSALLGLLIYIRFSIIRPESLWHLVGPEGNYSRIVAIALLAGWAMNGFGNWKLGKG